MTGDNRNIAQENQIVLLVGPRGKKFIIQLRKDARFQTNYGMIEHNQLIGLPWGSTINSHLGKPFILIEPGMKDLLLNTKRVTTIMYPKDIGFVLLNMNIGPGCRVIEAGTGSGAFTTALAFAIGDTGHVYSYDVRKEAQGLAMRNLEKVGLAHRVTLKNKDISLGFEENDVDACFLDLPNPQDYLNQVHAALKPGGFFGSLLPTANQVSDLLAAMEQQHFGLTEVCEIMLRYYKTNAPRLRPEDRMVAHTGYLVFARHIQNPGTGE